MTWTEEPRGLAFINNVNMAAFGPLMTQVCWVFGSILLTITAAWMMTRMDHFEPVGAFDPVFKTADGHAIRQMVMISHETIRQLGMTLATALLFAWTGKTAAGVYDNKNKREADPRYKEVLEAKERGKAAGAAAATVIKEASKDADAARSLLNQTKEREALRADPNKNGEQ